MYLRTATVSKHGFSLADILIFASTLLISISIGIYYALSGGKQKTTSEYFVGNRKMAIFPVMLSMLVSGESSIMMIGFPAETYVYGLQFLIVTFGSFFGRFVIARSIVPVIHKLRITSVYEVRYHNLSCMCLCVCEYACFRKLVNTLKGLVLVHYFTLILHCMLHIAWMPVVWRCIVIVDQYLGTYSTVPIYQLFVTQYLEIRFESHAVRLLGTILGMCSTVSTCYTHTFLLNRAHIHTHLHTPIHIHTHTHIGILTFMHTFIYNIIIR
jgi:hypothetical protein